jgi:hypothetical protein
MGGKNGSKHPKKHLKTAFDPKVDPNKIKEDFNT